MKWAVYVIRHKDSKVGKDVYVGHLAYSIGKLGKTLKRRLKTHKQLQLRNVAEETKLVLNSTNACKRLVWKTGKLCRFKVRAQVMRQWNWKK